MSLQPRSSTERLTPEYRPPDREPSPLDFPLDDVLPYDYESDSFTAISGSEEGEEDEEGFGDSPASFLSDTPDFDIVAAVDRSIADAELNLLLIQGEHRMQMQNRRDNMQAQHQEAMLLCRRVADLEHRLEVLSVQVRQLNQDEAPERGIRDNGGPSSFNAAAQSNIQPLVVGGEQIAPPTSEQEIAALARDHDLAKTLKRRFEGIDGRIGQVDKGLTANDDGPPYIFNAVDRRHLTDRNVCQAVDQILDGRTFDQLFEGEAESERGFGFDDHPTLQEITTDMFLRVAEVVRLENGLEREIFSRLRAAEVRLQSLNDEALAAPLRHKINWLHQQKENLRRLQREARINPDLNPNPTRDPFWPPFAYPAGRPTVQAPVTFRTREQFLPMLRVWADRNDVSPLDRDPAVSLVHARYRLWQTRRAADILAGVAVPPLRPIWREGDEESDYEDPFQSSSPVFEAAPPVQRRSTRNARDQLVNVEIARPRDGPRERRAPPTLPTNVIDLVDLTDEPDSPVIVTGARPIRHPSRNLRRHDFQVNPPPLIRSDSSLLGGYRGRPNGPQEVIDLTEDDPEPQRRGGGYQGWRARADLHANARARAREANQHRHLNFDLLSGPSHANNLESLRRSFAAQRTNLLGLLNPFLAASRAGAFDPIGPVNLHYEFHAFNGRRDASPKPAAEVAQPARPGFTRDTDPETAFVCPGCNEELAYDPDEAPATGPTRSKAKRSRSEHHFWALKSCGHVSFFAAALMIHVC
jgi:hypothetical protein